MNKNSHTLIRPMEEYERCNLPVSGVKQVSLQILKDMEIIRNNMNESIYITLTIIDLWTNLLKNISLKFTQFEIDYQQF